MAARYFLKSSSGGRVLIIVIHYWCFSQNEKLNYLLHKQSTRHFICLVILVEAVVGQSVELPCNVTAENEDDKLNILAWYRNGSATAFYR